MQSAMETLLNEAMRLERETHLGARAYERTEDRRGYANGPKSKTVQTRIGEMTVQVPQTHESTFYPTALEKGLRSERALRVALTEMYVQGVSTRKVSALTEKLCGTELSSMQVSRAAAALIRPWKLGVRAPFLTSSTWYWMPATKKYAARATSAIALSSLLWE